MFGNGREKVKTEVLKIKPTKQNNKILLQRFLQTSIREAEEARFNEEVIEVGLGMPSNCSQ